MRYAPLAAALLLASSDLAQPQSHIAVVNGPAFTPTADPRRIMLFSPTDGSLVDGDFIPGRGAEYDMDFPRDVMQVGHELWVSDQTQNSIIRFDLLGNFVGAIAGNMANIRGMELHDGTVYVTTGAGLGATPAHSIAMFSTAGAYLGYFPVNSQPFDVQFHNGELLVVQSASAASGLADITRWGLEGNALGDFHNGGAANVLHLHRRGDGTFIATGSSTPAGLYMLDAAGSQTNYIALTGPRSAHELANGNILYANSTGVHVYDPSAGSSTLIINRPGHFNNLITFDTNAAGACCLPDGSCSIITMAACGAQNGIYRGAGTTCSGPCPQPGACCLPTNTCVLAQPQACADQGGVFYGPGTPCTADTCLRPLRTAAPTSSFIAYDGSGLFLDFTSSTDLVLRRIDYFPVTGVGSPVTVQIYTRPGSYAGFTDSPDGWTLSDSIETTALGGTINATPLTLTNPIVLRQGQTTGVYIVGIAGGVRYRTGSTSINISNADLAVFTDTARPALFGGTPPSGTRSFAGHFYYSLGLGCGTSDYNGDGDFGTDQDIEAFFACLGGNCCPTCFPGGSDFNGDGDSGTDQDIEAFFRVLGGGPC